MLRLWLQPEVRALFQPVSLQPDEVRYKSAAQWVPAPVWIDARTEKAYQRKHIPGAWLLNTGEAQNFDTLVFEIDKSGAFDGDRKVVVYEDSYDALTSKEVAARLQERYPHLEVFVLRGLWR